MYFLFQLETIAQRWADQCQFGHDQIRNVERFRVGQNVFQATTTVAGLHLALTMGGLKHRYLCKNKNGTEVSPLLAF